jgi:hypothetical protein
MGSYGNEYSAIFALLVLFIITAYGIGLMTP